MQAKLDIGSKGKNHRTPSSFRENTDIVLGKGRKTMFSRDAQCGEAILCSRYMKVYNIARDKNVLVVDLWRERTNNDFWDV